VYKRFYRKITRAQLSQRKPTVALVCYWQTDDIHTFCDVGYLKLIVAVRAKRGKIMVRYCHGQLTINRSGQAVDLVTWLPWGAISRQTTIHFS